MGSFAFASWELRRRFSVWTSPLAAGTCDALIRDVEREIGIKGELERVNPTLVSNGEPKLVRHYTIRHPDFDDVSVGLLELPQEEIRADAASKEDDDTPREILVDGERMTWWEAVAYIAHREVPAVA